MNHQSEPRKLLVVAPQANAASAPTFHVKALRVAILHSGSATGTPEAVPRRPFGLTGFERSAASHVAARRNFKLARLVSSPTEELSLMNFALDELTTLGPDWDGSGAEAPSANAIAFARELLARLDSADRLPDSVDADAVGGVALWFYEKEGSPVLRFAVEIRNSSRIIVSVETSGASPQVLRPAWDVDAVAETVEQLTAR